MPNFPVRNLGGAGVISDIHPYDLPPNAFSAGVNVRFENGKISRAPTLLTVHEFSDDTFAPSFMFQIPAIGSLVDSLVCVNSDVTQLTQVTGSTEADVTHPSASPVTLIGSMTATFLGSVTYLNNNAMVPLYKRTTDSTFAELPGWDPEWRCKSLRAYKDFLVALNVTKDGVEYPSMVKWPDITPFGDAPGSWDSTLTTNSAGENILTK